MYAKQKDIFIYSYAYVTDLRLAHEGAMRLCTEEKTLQGDKPLRTVEAL